MVLLLKLVLTPAIVVAATLAGRRYGPAASGWFIGLPLTSGPITVFFAVEHGRHFAARAAVGSLGGAIAEVAFCVGYAAAARRGGWRTAVLTGSASFAGTAALLEALPLGPRLATLGPLTLAAAAALLAGLAVVPQVRVGTQAPELLPSRWELPARAVTATVFLLALTALATTLGARLSGLLAVYPLYTVVLAAFAHRLEGAAAAVQILRGLLVGLFSFVCFYFALAASLAGVGTAGAFALSLTAALAVQALSLRPLLRVAAA
jgi:hypothetical protein